MVWQILTDGSSWINEFPNAGEQEVAVVDVSTMKTVDLIDGSQAYLTPETATRKQPISFKITASHSPTEVLAARTAILAQMQAKRRVILVTHENEQLTGRFTRVSKVYRLLKTPQQYSLEVEFLPE